MRHGAALAYRAVTQVPAGIKCIFHGEGNRLPCNNYRGIAPYFNRGLLFGSPLKVVDITYIIIKKDILSLVAPEFIVSKGYKPCILEIYSMALVVIVILVVFNAVTLYNPMK